MLSSQAARSPKSRTIAINKRNKRNNGKYETFNSKRIQNTMGVRKRSRKENKNLNKYLKWKIMTLIHEAS